MTNNQLTDLRTLILSEVGDFFAGVGSPGEPGTPEEMQRELSMRLGRILNNHIVNYPRCEALVGILRECRIARDEAQAELQERRKADSEPVAEVVSIYGDPEAFGEREIRPLVGIQQMPYGTKLYRHAQPAKGLELAGWQFKSVNGDWLGLIDEHGKNQAVREGCEVREVFAMADGVNERDQVRREHAEWSQATFGNVGPVGPLKHLSKEALEAAEQPGDLSEWADMQFLLWDAQRRAGITDEQITQAMSEKLAVNKQRSWPEPKDGEPRLHIKQQPEPVVPDKMTYQDGALFVLNNDMSSIERGTVAMRAWNACRAAMLQGAENTESRCGNAPVIPDGYVMVPMRLTAENGAKGVLSGEFSETKFVNCPECFGDDECETCDGSGRIEIKVPVSWTTIKDIWIKGIEHFAAAPQENN